jgi:hypothetical protein
MRLTTVAVLALMVFAPCSETEAARRRSVRCCVMVPDDAGGERPYCFLFNAGSARVGRRLCRAIGGTPPRHPTR